MDKNELEARIKEIRAKLDADKERNALEKELRGLEDEYNIICAKELIPSLLEDEADNHCVTVKDGQFELEVYKDYRDEVSMETIRDIVQSEDPMLAYENSINEMYDRSADYYIDELLDAVYDRLDEQGIVVTDEIKEYAEDYFRGRLDLKYPNFDNQEVNVNIIIDSGDANYEYTLNSQYPGTAYNAERPAQPGEEGYTPYDPEDILDPKAGIVWLASTQGYTLQQLHKALLDDGIFDREQKKDFEKYLASVKADPEMSANITDEAIRAVYNRKNSFVPSFLASMNEELRNCSSSTPCVTFLVKMTLGELIKLQELIKMQDRNGRNYDATKNPDCGTLTLGKETQTGLFDMISGGGSLNFDICLEKDVDIPIRFIRSATPDINNCQGIDYCVGNVYGFCGNVWRNTVKNIAEPTA